MAVAPPRPKSPPLNSLRALEAELRNGSFTAAARELNVTQGAIAQQVKIAEHWAGASLFERKSQGIEPNTIGKSILPGLEAAFDALGTAAGELRRAAAPHNFTIATLPSIAQLWLSPRLPALRDAFPGLNLTIVAMEGPPNMMREQFDFALFFTSTNTRDEGEITLAEDKLAPMCSPGLVRKIRAIPETVSAKYLYDTAWSKDWDEWLAFNPDFPRKASGHFTYSLYSLALEEAQQGAGILIGHYPLVKPLLETGKLCALSDNWTSTGAWLTLRFMQHQAKDKTVSALLDWFRNS